METEVDENGGGGRGYWHRFTKMVSHLRELQLLNLLADQAIAEVAHSKVTEQPQLLHVPVAKWFEWTLIPFISQRKFSQLSWISLTMRENIVYK